MFGKLLVPGKTPSPLNNKMTKQLQSISNAVPLPQSISQGLTQEESHLTTWVFSWDPETSSYSIQPAESSILPQPQLSNYHLDLSSSFSESMYNPIQPDAITLDPIAGHLSQMSNSPLDSLTGSPQPQSINSPAQGSFPPSLHSSFLNSIYSSNLNSSTHLLTSSPQPHSINSPAWESFPPSLLPSFSNSRYSLKQKPPLYLLTSSPQSQSVNSSVGSPVSEATDNQVHTVAILDICHHAGCSNELIQQAKYKSGKELREGPDKGTPARILNYLAMVEVLTKMEYGSTAMDPIQVKHYYHGTPLTGSQLISTFGRSINSFKHKSGWFSWAEQNMYWNPQMSSKGRPVVLHVCLILTNIFQCILRSMPYGLALSICGAKVDQ